MNDANAQTILECHGISKSYGAAPHQIEVLRGIDFSVASGECVAIIGASGSGKSTLLHVLGSLEPPEQGQIQINNQDPYRLNDRQRSHWRNQTLGFVYQFHHLIEELTALENIALPLMIQGCDDKIVRERVMSLIDQFGLNERAHHRPNTLSGGERQRVAIARALISRPKCLLADEPTGNLDPDVASVTFNAMLSHSRTLQASVLIVTHNYELARKCDRVMRLNKGLLQPHTLA